MREASMEIVFETVYYGETFTTKTFKMRCVKFKTWRVWAWYHKNVKSPLPSKALKSLGAPGDNWYPELPTIYPPLVIPAAHTRLAVPVSPLMGHEQFEVDVLGLSGWSSSHVQSARAEKHPGKPETWLKHWKMTETWLKQDSFLGTGVPLLTASLVQENGLSKVQITLHSAGWRAFGGWMLAAMFCFFFSATIMVISQNVQRAFSFGYL